MKSVRFILIVLLAAVALLTVSCSKDKGGKIKDVQGNYTLIAQKGQALVGCWDAEFMLPARDRLEELLAVYESMKPAVKTVDDSPPSATDIIPKNGEIPLWEVSENKIRTYKGKDLFKYIDGGADLYHSYGFREVATAEYVQPKLDKDPLIVIDVYEMENPSAAFGIYSHLRYPEALFKRFGNEAVFGYDTLYLWKGKFFVKVLAFEISDDIQTGMEKAATLITSRITDAGDLPPIVRSLPPTGKIRGSEQYFTQKLALDNLHYISEENVLMLGEQTEGVIAGYDVPENGEHTVFVVLYPSASDAVKAFESYDGFLAQRSEKVEIDLMGGNFSVFNFATETPEKQ